MLTDTAAYVERYRWTPTIATAIAGDLAFVAVAVFMSPPLIIRVLVIVVFGWFAVYSVAGVLSRRIALQVDEAGVTLGGGPFRYQPVPPMGKHRADRALAALYLAHGRPVDAFRPGSDPLHRPATTDQGHRRLQQLGPVEQTRPPTEPRQQA